MANEKLKPSEAQQTILIPEAAARFDTLVRKVLSVPHEEIMRREAEYKRQSALNPNRRGPKRKSKGKDANSR